METNGSDGQDRHDDGMKIWKRAGFLNLAGKDRIEIELGSGGLLQLVSENGRWIALCSDGMTINGAKKNECELRWRDRIEAGGELFVFLETALAGETIREEDVIRKSARLAFAPCEIDFSSPEPSVITLELPEPQNEAPASSSAGPALMMLASAGASMICSIAVSGSEPKAVLASGTGSLAMAGVMIGFTLFSKRKDRISRQRRMTAQIEEYGGYIREEFEKAERIRQQAIECHAEARKALLDLGANLPAADEKPWTLPAGIQSYPLAAFEKAHGSLRKAPEACRQILENALASEITVPGFQIAQEGGWYDCSHFDGAQMRRLYLLWVRMAYTPDTRLAWIGFEEPQVVLSASRLEEKALYFEDWSSFLSFKEKASGIRFTVFCRNLPAQKADDLSVFCFGSSAAAMIPTERIGRSYFPHREPDEQLIRSVSMGKVPLRPEENLLSRFCRRSNPGQPADLCAELAPNVIWDLRKDGPHALVAGSTGSGKSEGLSLALLQLACKNSPKQLQLILIDFKGGSFAAPLANLPHTAGILTNLLEGSAERMETALQQELDRRQTLIAKAVQEDPSLSADASHCLKADHGHPLSELLIVADEFGQLKSRCPQFMKSLQETARIGRSLGVHLILSTQKPAGLVDEQIWANSQSKLCFRVLDPADSREVLSDQKAFELKLPGEFILKGAAGREQSGRAYFLKADAEQCGTIRIAQKGKPFKEIPSVSLQQKMQEYIAGKNEARRWILHPDPYESREDSSQILEDAINKAVPFALEAGEKAAIGGNRSDLIHALQLLAAQSGQPVISTIFLKEADQIVEIHDLYFLEEAGKEVLVIVQADDPLPEPLISLLLGHPKLTVIFAFEHPGYKCEGLLSKIQTKIAFDFSSREEQAIFCGQSLQKGKPRLASVIRNEQKMRLIFGSRIPQTTRPEAKKIPVCILKAERKQALEEADTGLIGLQMPERKPLFLYQKCLLCYACDQGRQQADLFLERMICRNPLIGCGKSLDSSERFVRADLNKQPDLLKEAASKMPVLFFGQGLQGYAHSLGISLPYGQQGNAWLIESGSVRDLEVCTLCKEELCI